MCIYTSRIATVCGHLWDNRCTEKCSLASALFTRSCTSKKALHIRLGWCDDCRNEYHKKSHGQPRLALHSRRVILQYWAYKSKLQTEKTFGAKTIPRSFFDTPVDLEYGGDPAEDQHPLLWEERVLWRQIFELKPQYVEYEGLPRWGWARNVGEMVEMVRTARNMTLSLASRRHPDDFDRENINMAPKMDWDAVGRVYPFFHGINVALGLELREAEETTTRHAPRCICLEPVRFMVRTAPTAQDEALGHSGHDPGPTSAYKSLPTAQPRDSSRKEPKRRKVPSPRPHRRSPRSGRRLSPLIPPEGPSRTKSAAAQTRKQHAHPSRGSRRSEDRPRSVAPWEEMLGVNKDRVDDRTLDERCNEPCATAAGSRDAPVPRPVRRPSPVRPAIRKRHFNRKPVPGERGKSPKSKAERLRELDARWAKGLAGDIPTHDRRSYRRSSRASRIEEGVLRSPVRFDSKEVGASQLSPLLPLSSPAGKISVAHGGRLADDAEHEEDNPIPILTSDRSLIGGLFAGGSSQATSARSSSVFTDRSSVHGDIDGEVVLNPGPAHRVAESMRQAPDHSHLQMMVQLAAAPINRRGGPPPSPIRDRVGEPRQLTPIPRDALPWT